MHADTIYLEEEESDYNKVVDGKREEGVSNFGSCIYMIHN